MAKGTAEVKRMLAAAKAAAKATFAKQAARQENPGGIADEQVGTIDPRQAQRGLAGLPNYEEGSDAKRK